MDKQEKLRQSTIQSYNQQFFGNKKEEYLVFQGQTILSKEDFKLIVESSQKGEGQYDSKRPHIKYMIGNSEIPTGSKVIDNFTIAGYEGKIIHKFTDQ